MENVLTRYRNATVLVVVLFVQLIGLATQVRRHDPSRPEGGSTRLIRVWTVNSIAPIQKGFVGTGRWFRGLWSGYVDLRGARAENEQLKQQLEDIRLEQVRMSEDARQGRRLQSLLDFKEQFASHTVAAQVIGTSGSETSRTIFLDKGADANLKVDQAVVTPHGIIGKVIRVFPRTAQVLQIDDQTSGAGVILEKSRLRGILRGLPSGELEIRNIMATEEVEIGQRVLTTGGDRVYPRGLPVGNVVSVHPDREDGLFLSVRVKPSANLSQLEEVLVITEILDKSVDADAITAPLRAADVLSDRLPTFRTFDQLQSEQSSGARKATPTAPGAVEAARQAEAQKEAQKQNAAPAATAPKPNAPAAGTPAAGQPAARPNAEPNTAQPKPPTATQPKPAAPKPQTPNTEVPR